MLEQGVQNPHFLKFCSSFKSSPVPLTAKASPTSPAEVMAPPLPPELSLSANCCVFFYKYLMSIASIPGTILGTGDTAVNRTDKSLPSQR